MTGSSVKSRPPVSTVRDIGRRLGRWTMNPTTTDPTALPGGYLTRMFQPTSITLTLVIRVGFSAAMACTVVP
jgi:hypothetical protein